MPEAWEPTEVNDLLAEDEPDYVWLIPGLLEEKDRVIFTGNEGLGKSTFIRQFGWQVACGISPFTLEPIEPQNVLLIDFENPRRLIKRALKRLYEVQQPEAGRLSVLSYPAGMDFTSPVDVMRMQTALSLTRPKLVVGGPMYKMAPDLTTEEVSASLQQQLDLWREQFGFAVILEAHQPQETITQTERYRPARPYGSSLWRRWPEFGLCLFNGGRIFHWRGDRDERNWPEQMRWGEEEEWPWVIGVSQCLHCKKDLTEGQDKYCDDRCGNAHRQARWRANKRG